MSETMVTVVGNVATAPVYRELPSGPVARFRLASTTRRRDRETGTWTDGHTSFFTIWAWRTLGTNVAASLSVGEPVIVQGRLRVRGEDRDGGQQWMSADIDAVAVGHDLARGTAAFHRTPRRDGTPTAPGRTSPGERTEGSEVDPVSWERPPEEGGPPKRQEETPQAAGRPPGEAPPREDGPAATAQGSPAARPAGEENRVRRGKSTKPAQAGARNRTRQRVPEPVP